MTKPSGQSTGTDGTKPPQSTETPTSWPERNRSKSGVALGIREGRFVRLSPSELRELGIDIEPAMTISIGLPKK